jgi:uncharacterized protein (TIGR02757 family)
MPKRDSASDEVLTMLPVLENAYRTYHRLEFLGTDPLEWVHRSKNEGEPFLAQEATALLSGLMAYGNAQQIRKFSNRLLQFIKAEGAGDLVQGVLRIASSTTHAQSFLSRHSAFVYRFQPVTDWVCLIRLIGRSWETYGSVGAHFGRHHSSDAATIESGLAGLRSDWEEWLKATGVDLTLRSSLRHLIASPADGSACKRWCMVLRWMGRQDGIDPGLWLSPEVESHLSPSQLVVPLDVHMARVSRSLGLQKRKAVDWKSALEVTGTFKKIEPKDPLKYDFALCRAGMLAARSRVG